MKGGNRDTNVQMTIAPKSIVLLETKWATNWAKEEPGHKVKNRDTEYSFPKLATISPVKNWITSMITFPPVDNEQPWAWQRKATHPSSLAANLSCYKHTFSTLKTSVGLL